jgi:hypothetical protein
MSPIIFVLPPHNPKVAAALQVLDLCSWQAEAEGEHWPQLSSFNRKIEMFLPPALSPPYHLKQLSAHISIGIFQCYSVSMQDRREIGKDFKATDSICHIPNAKNTSTEKVRVHPSL